MVMEETYMNKQLTEIIFVLDRSGSMGGLEKDTIGGFNSLLQKQLDAPGNAILSTILFDHEVSWLHYRHPIEHIQPLNEQDYQVRGSTSLLDAIGTTIYTLSNKQSHTPPEHRPHKTLCIIITDGHENSSKEYSLSSIRTLIEVKKSQNWEFLFLGANIDAIKEASKFGIDPDFASNYRSDTKGTQTNFREVEKVMRTVRSNERIDKSWKKEIEDDFDKRS